MWLRPSSFLGGRSRVCALDHRTTDEQAGGDRPSYIERSGPAHLGVHAKGQQHMTDTDRAISVDGERFEFFASPQASYRVGDYVAIDGHDDAPVVGQILGIDLRSTEPPQLHATGELTGPSPSFVGAAVRPAEAHEIEAAILSDQPGLRIGQLCSGHARSTAHLRATGFGRHTFMCGQSGSGKTYSMGVILENLLAETSLRMIVIDPNSDYTHLGSIDAGRRGDRDPSFADRLAAAGERVFVAGSGHDHELRVRFGRLTIEQQAVVLRLDPLQDAAEFSVFLSIIAELATTEYGLHEIVDLANTRSDPASERLALRIQNLRLVDAPIWAAPDAPTILDQVPADWRALVVDLGSLASARDRAVIAASLTTSLWESRRNREPVLLVIDEAHNVCPSNARDADQAMATDAVVSMAAEGRKFGQFLMVATQRPDKVHEDIVSQCDNLVLMRMNSASDIARLVDLFSHVPAGLIRRSSSFTLGEGLVAGRIADRPLLFETGARLTPEGGSDLPTTWALPTGAQGAPVFARDRLHLQG